MNELDEALDARMRQLEREAQDSKLRRAAASLRGLPRVDAAFDLDRASGGFVLLLAVGAPIAGLLGAVASPVLGMVGLSLGYCALVAVGLRVLGRQRDQHERAIYLMTRLGTGEGVIRLDPREARCREVGRIAKRLGLVRRGRLLIDPETLDAPLRRATADLREAAARGLLAVEPRAPLLALAIELLVEEGALRWTPTGLRARGDTTPYRGGVGALGLRPSEGA